MTDIQVKDSDQTQLVPWETVGEYPEIPAYAQRRAEYRELLKEIMEIPIDEKGRLPDLTHARRIVADRAGVSLKTVERYTRGFGLTLLNDGRPSSYDETIATEILRRIASGETIESICSDSIMPSVPTLWEWRHKIPGLDKAIDRARRLGAQSMIDQAVEVTTSAATKDQSYIARNASDALFRAAGMWDERFRDKYQGVSGGVQLTINTNLDLPARDTGVLIAQSNDDISGGNNQ